ncbi:MAG: PAS domain S-box protein, partial [bacterium]
QPIVVLDKDLRIVAANNAFYHTFKTSPEQTINKFIYDLGNRQWDITELHNLLEKVIPEKIVIENYRVAHDFPHIGKKIMSIRAKFIQPPDPELKMILLTIQDITNQKRLEEALKTRISEWQKIFDSTLDAIFVLTADQKIIKANKSALELFQVKEEEVLEKHCWEVVHATDKPVPMCPFIKMSGSMQREYMAMSVNDKRFEVTVDPIFDIDNNFVGAVHIVRDITLLKEIEKKLSASEEKYRLITEHLPDMVLIHSGEKILYANNMVLEKLGLKSIEQLKDIPIMNFVHPDYRDIVQERIKSILTDKKTAEPLEEKFIISDGEIIDVEVRGVPIEFEGKPAVQLIIRDITEKKRAEQALKKSEERNRLIAENIGDVIIILDTSMKITYASPSVQRLTGYTSTEGIGQSIYKFMPPESANKIQEVIAEEIILEQKGVPPERTRHIELPIYHKNGSLLWIDLTSTFLRDEKGRPQSILTIFHDISERKKREEEITLKLKEFETLLKTSTSLRKAHTEEEMFPVFLDEVLGLLNCEVGAIFLYQEGIKALKIAYARGWIKEFLGHTIKPTEGIAGKVFTSGETYVCRDLKKDPNVCPAISSAPEGWGALGVPIRSTDEVIGLFYIFAPTAREFSDEEIKLINSLSEMVGIALHRIRLYQDARKQIERLQTMQNIDRVILETMDKRILFNVFLREIIVQLRINAMGVLLLDSDGLTLQYEADYGFKTDIYKKTRLKLGEGFAGKAGLEGRRFYIPDIRESKEFKLPKIMAEEGYVAYICQPFMAKGQLIGVIEIFNSEPLKPEAEWFNYLETIAQQAAIAVDNIKLFENLQRTQTELLLAYESTIEGWSYAMDLRDRETEGHSQRVTEMTLRLARELGMKESELIYVKYGALLHDIGKLGVPDAILFKPDQLTDEEWLLMRKHPVYAYEMLIRIEYLRPAIDIPYCHHERWDGSGYPRGLKGKEIPLPARIFAIADTFDALSSDRPYRNAWPREKIIEYIKSQKGKQFDPKVVDAFLKIYASDYL